VGAPLTFEPPTLRSAAPALRTATVDISDDLMTGIERETRMAVACQ
jgi:hypothetical protein